MLKVSAVEQEDLVSAFLLPDDIVQLRKESYSCRVEGRKGLVVPLAKYSAREPGRWQFLLIFLLLPGGSVDRHESVMAEQLQDPMTNGMLMRQLL